MRYTFVFILQFWSKVVFLPLLKYFLSHYYHQLDKPDFISISFVDGKLVLHTHFLTCMEYHLVSNVLISVSLSQPLLTCMEYHLVSDVMMSVSLSQPAVTKTLMLAFSWGLFKSYLLSFLHDDNIH